MTAPLIITQMKQILLIGLNHKTAPVAVRECIAFSADEAISMLTEFRNDVNISESMLISTCNRVEVLLTTEHPQQAVNAVKQFIAAMKNLPASSFEDYLYIYQDSQAVRHIFMVASSLDSMVVGEPQILGQIKQAYRVATQQKTSGVILNRLLHKTFSVAKRVRTETGIGDHAVSISYAAIQLARKIFGTLEHKAALLIGAGEMAELAVEHLIRNRAERIFVANRTFERGVELARKYQGQALKFEEIERYLEEVDIIISSTGAPGYVITVDQVKACMRRRKQRPLFFIDIAVPRDIDPYIHKLDNAYLYDIDDLKGVVDENIEDRNREAVKGCRIVDEAVISYWKWYESLEAIPTIVALRDKIKQIAEAEITRTLHSMEPLPEKDELALRKMTESMINKILHHPTLYLKENGCKVDKSAAIDMTRKLFHLDDQPFNGSSVDEQQEAH